MIDRFMRIMLFFDLPAVTRTDKREYLKFKKVLKKRGFMMLQESVYTKLALNQSVVDSTMKQIKDLLPKEGLVSVLTITEQQFSSIEHLLGSIESEQIISEDKVIKL